MTTDNRTNEPIADNVDALLSQIESARILAGFMSAWDVSPEQLETLRSDLESVERYAALLAAATIPHPVIDEAALAEVIAKSRGFGNGWEQIPPLTRGAYREIARAVAEWLKERAVAEKYGIAQMTVSNIKTGKTWGHITGR